MYPELGDLYDNFYPMVQNMGQNMGFGGSSGSGGDATGGSGGLSGLAGMMGSMPFMGGDLQDMMSDVVDNMKDGDIVDVMENLLPMSQMGLPGLDMNSIMSGGMPDLSGIMQGLSPYLAMDGDFYGDFGDMGDIYGYASDMYEDYMKYGGMMGGMGGNPMLRKNRMHKRRAHKPSRLLKRTGNKKHLRHKREFPFFAMQQAQGEGASGSQSRLPFFGFDSPDSEDLAAFLMMGGNRQAIPPPLDGIDTEDMWMYRGTKWDPMAMFRSATASTGTGADGAQQPVNPWLYALLSGLQKRHMQQKKL